MSSPKIVIKSGYMESVMHALNLLEYAGNKIDQQEVFLTDGTIVPFSDKRIDFEYENLTNVKYIQCYTKDGKKYSFTKDKYNEIMSNEKLVTVSKIVTSSKDLYREMKDMDFMKYLSYIEGREGSVKEDDTGLFDLYGNISIKKAKEMAKDYKDNIVWSHIISLPEDDTRGFDNRKIFADFIRSIAPDIAKTYNISFENLVINGAFHNNTDNAHVHLLMYSKDKSEGFLVGGNKALISASEKLKSKFVNGIYKTDVDTLKELINKNRVEMKSEIDKSIDLLLNSKDFDRATKEKFSQLHNDLKAHKGRLIYGYLDPKLKHQVDTLLYELVNTSKPFTKIYTELLNCQKEYIKLYTTDETKINSNLASFEQKIFHPKKGDRTTLHNILIEASYSPCENIPPKIIIQNNTETQILNKATKNKNLPYKKFTMLSNYYDIDSDNFDMELEYSFLAEDKINETDYDAIIEYNKSDIFNYKDISNKLAYSISRDSYRPFYKAVDGLLNPLTENTTLQNELISEFENLVDRKGGLYKINGKIDTDKISKESLSKIIKILKTDNDFKELLDVKKLMRPHFIPINIAKNLDVFEFNLELRNDNEMKNLKRLITKSLEEFILSDSHSSEFIKSSFLTGNTNEIFKTIYHFDDNVHHAFDNLEFENKQLGEQFKNHILNISHDKDFEFNPISSHINYLYENFDDVLCDAFIFDGKDLSDFPYMNETLKEIMYNDDFADFAMIIKPLNTQRVELIKKKEFNNYNKVIEEIEQCLKDYLSKNLYLDDNILDFADLINKNIIEKSPKDITTLFIDKMFNGSLKIPENKDILNFVANIENKYVTQSIRNVKDTENPLYKEFYKELSTCLNEHIFLLGDEINELKELDKLDFDEWNEKFSNVLERTKTKIGSEELTKLSTSFNNFIHEDLAKTVPEALKSTTFEKLDTLIDENNIAIPINQILYHSLTENLEKTYMSATSQQNHEEMREFNKKIFSIISKTLYDRKDVIFFRLIKNHAQPSEILEYILSKDVSKDLAKDINLLKENIKKAYEEITKSDATDNVISDIFLNSSFSGALTNIEYISTTTDKLIQKINNEKIINALLHCSRGISQIMCSDSQKTNNLSKNKETNLTHSKSNLIRRKANISY